MSNIQRFNFDGFDGGMVPKSDGGWMFYADHAAELARVEGEREETRKAWCLLRSALNAIAWGVWDNDAFPRRTAQDALAIGCPVANGRAEKSAAKSLEAANALLRAECEAWRKRRQLGAKVITDGNDASLTGSVCAYDRADKALDQARAATDAAGILKGGEQ